MGGGGLRVVRVAAEEAREGVGGRVVAVPGRLAVHRGETGRGVPRDVMRSGCPGDQTG